MPPGEILKKRSLSARYKELSNSRLDPSPSFTRMLEEIQPSHTPQLVNKRLDPFRAHTKMRFTLWITTVIHLDTPTKDLTRFGPLAGLWCERLLFPIVIKRRAGHGPHQGDR